LLLVKAAAVSKCDAVKFQIVYVEELAQPGNVHYDVFRRLEMPADEWARVREYARRLGIHFITDVFGERSLELARTLDVDGIKVHSTSFFDHALVEGALTVGCPVYFSIGGIEGRELGAFIVRHGLRHKRNVSLLYGFQAEPTPVESNHLARIPAIAAKTQLPVGFVDHSDGAGPDDIALSLVALGLGVRLFEKHVTLDRALALEDYVSAVPPGRLGEYVATLRRNLAAIGSSDATLSEAERSYRGRALKRVTAARTLHEGHQLSHTDLRLMRPAIPDGGALDPDLVVGRRLRSSVQEGAVIEVENVE
jgi:N,N'-diacetyllegionaminate synthase